MGNMTFMKEVWRHTIVNTMRLACGELLAGQAGAGSNDPDYGPSRQVVCRVIVGAKGECFRS